MRGTAVAGIALVVVGIIIAAVGAFLLMGSGTTQQTGTNLLGANSFVVAAGDNENFGFPVSAGNSVTGTFTQTNGTSVNLYFMTANQQNAFGNCAPCSSPSLANISSSKSYNFNWPVNSTGTYYLVLDNSNGGSNVAVTLTAKAVASSSNSSMLSTPYILIILGVIVLIVGAVVAAMGSRGPKAPPVMKPPPPQSANPQPPNQSSSKHDQDRQDLKGIRNSKFKANFAS